MDRTSTSERRVARGMGIFAVIWTGQLISVLGSGLTGFAMGVWLYQTTGKATIFALNSLAYFLPTVLLSPIVGALVDRFDRRLMMIVSDTASGLCTATLALLFLTGHLQVWHVYATTFISAAFSSVQWPAYTAAVTLMVPKKHLGRASGMMQIGQAISQLLTPAIAGLLFVSIGLGKIMLIDFATFLIAVSTMLAVRFPQPEKTEVGQSVKGSLWKEGMFGWHYIKERPGLLGLLLYFAAWNLFWGIGNVILLPMVLALASADKVGVLASVVGIGALVGTVLMSAWGGPKRRVLGILGLGFVSGFLIMGMGVSPNLYIIAAAAFLFMLVTPILGGLSQALWQTKVEPDLQGRVFAIRRMIAWSSTIIAAPVAGPLADKVFGPLLLEGGPLAASLGPIFGVGQGRGMGLLMVLMGILLTISSMVFVTFPRVRNLEAEIPDAIHDEEEKEQAVIDVPLPEGELETVGAAGR